MKENLRPNIDEYFLNIAEVVSTRSTCLRKHYGAVIAKNKHIVSTGYNNPPAGEPHCQVCRKTKHGKDISSYLDCCSVHAEQNAIILANPIDMQDSTLYLAGYDVEKEAFFEARPCEICLRLIKNTGISKVITRAGVIYARDRQGILKDIDSLAATDLQSYMNAKIGEGK